MTLDQEDFELNPEERYFDESFCGQIEPTVLGFLNQLTGLSIFDIKGIDQTRTRVITTLIHGNEPSGFIACHQWLVSQQKPATNIRIIICNPEAAKTKPKFSHRYLFHSEDLNRYFASDENNLTEVSIRAKKIKKAISAVNPEAIIDLHNTSGASPAFAVAVNENTRTLDLVVLFTSKLILTGLKVGALMEQDFKAPIVTIECGGANETTAHQVALQGLTEYVSKTHLFDRRSKKVEVHRHPIRLELVGDASVGFSNARLPTTDITLRADLEVLNRQLTPVGEFLGWYEPKRALLIQALDEQGQDQIHHLLEMKNGSLFAKQTMQFFMVTPILEIATNDCLCYVTVE